MMPVVEKLPTNLFISVPCTLLGVLADELPTAVRFMLYGAAPFLQKLRNENFLFMASPALISDEPKFFSTNQTSAVSETKLPKKTKPTQHYPHRDTFTMSFIFIDFNNFIP